MNASYSQEQLISHAKLTAPDIEQINHCRRNYNRLGFGYQIGFVRLNNRFPTQQPFEIIDDLLTFIGVQLQIDTNEIGQYQRRQPTISQRWESDFVPASENFLNNGFIALMNKETMEPYNHWSIEPTEPLRWTGL